MLSAFSIAYAIEVGGHLTEDTIWSPENNPYLVTGVVYVDDGLELYNSAIYIHGFRFQQIADINTDDGVDPTLDVAFRDIPLTFVPDVESGTLVEEMTVTVNLDDDPL